MRVDEPTAKPAETVEAAWQSALLRAAQQGLEDLTVAGVAEVVFLRAKRASTASAFFDDLADAARKRGFCTTRVAVQSDRSFDTLDGLVRNLLRSVCAPGDEGSRRGWAGVLDAFVRAAPSPTEALRRFEEGVATYSAHGDLASLSRDYLEDATGRSAPAGRIDAWLAGTDLSRVEARATVLGRLDPASALRALGEFTRLVRALGHRGTLMVFEGAEVLARLSAARRDGAYTVLRELVDNADGARGLVSAQLWIGATALLFDGARGIATSRPLATRVLAPGAFEGELPPPHRPLVDLAPPSHWKPPAMLPIPLPAVRAEAVGLRAVLRAAHGLPPVDANAGLTVGHERIDATIDDLFRHASLESSVFAVVVGAYGAGKSHLLTHLAARSIAERRPVFRLSLEYLDADLGHPQRHLHRMLEHAVLPGAVLGSATDRLVRWTRDAASLALLVATLEGVAKEPGDASTAATKVLGRMRRTKRSAVALEAFLSTADLRSRPASPGYRKDAYQRFQLWLALLERIDGCRAPVLVIDEAENLFRAFTASQRRAALRSLAYYCGGTLPGSCVVLAITPEALERLRGEADALLADVAEQRTVLPVEDATMLRRRLHQARPIEVPALDFSERVQLVFKVLQVHGKVRTPIDDRRLATWATSVVERAATPRELMRTVVDHLEQRWWQATASVGEDG